MKFRRSIIFLGTLFLFSTVAKTQLSLQCHWEDDFTKTEQEKLTSWVNTVGKAVSQTLGNYPFTTHIYFHKATQGNGPVPWAHTWRENEQAVHFHVNTSYSLQQFLADWTAAHEIAHLSIPFVGDQYRWLSEGYASYMQWQIMHNQGLLSAKELLAKYATKIEQVSPKYASNKSFVELTLLHTSNYNYPALYYGGACFFMQANKQLEKQGSSLAVVIRQYLNTRRFKDYNAQSLMKSLDMQIEAPIFQNLFKHFLKANGYQTVGLTSL